MEPDPNLSLEGSHFDPWSASRAEIRARYGGANRKTIAAWTRGASDFDLRRPALAGFLALAVPELTAVKVAASLTRGQLEDLAALGLGSSTEARLTTRRGVMIALGLYKPKRDGLLRAAAARSAAVRASRARSADVEPI